MNQILRKSLLIISLTLNLLLGFRVGNFLKAIENILNKETENRNVEIINGIVENTGNLWLSWVEYDRHPKNISPDYWKERHQHYIYWFVQKFDSNGVAVFSAIEMGRGKFPPEGSFWGSPIYQGKSGDIYYSPAGGKLGRVDARGNHFLSDKAFRSLGMLDIFIDKRGMIYIISEGYGGASSMRKCTIAMIQEPLPIYIHEKEFPELFRPEAIKYQWLYAPDLRYCDSLGNYGIFLLPPIFPVPPDWEKPPLVDISKINVYIVSLPDMDNVDTSSFVLNEALFKKIRGCKLRTYDITSLGRKVRWINVSSLVEGTGDTLLLYLSSRGTEEDLIFVCKLTKDGKPIKAKEVIEERVKDFSDAPDVLQRKIIFEGSVIGSSGPTGIMIYGFDKSGNVYYYVWDKSDDYWKTK